MSRKISLSIVHAFINQRPRNPHFELGIDILLDDVNDLRIIGLDIRNAVFSRVLADIPIILHNPRFHAGREFFNHAKFLLMVMYISSI